MKNMIKLKHISDNIIRISNGITSQSLFLILSGFNLLTTNVPIILKPVSWFALQIYMMGTLVVKGLITITFEWDSPFWVGYDNKPCIMQKWLILID